MPATVTPLSTKRPTAAVLPPAESPRRPFRDHPRLILAGIVLLVPVLLLILAVANRTPALSPDDLRNADVRPSRDLLSPEVARQRVQMVDVYRAAPGSLPQLEPVVDLAAPSLPPGSARAAADRLAAQVLAGSRDTRSVE